MEGPVFLHQDIRVGRGGDRGRPQWRVHVFHGRAGQGVVRQE